MFYDYAKYNLKLFEYQAKQQFAQYHIPIPKGVLVTSVEAARRAVTDFNGSAIIKPQSTHLLNYVGVAHNQEEANNILRHIFQQSFTSLTIRTILIEEMVTASEHIHLTIDTDLTTGKLRVRATKQNRHQHLQATTLINPFLGLRNYQARDLASDMGLSRQLWRDFITILENTLRCYIDNDATLIEFSPMGVALNKQFIVLNSRMHIDDNAVFRHTDLYAIQSADQPDEATIKAQQANIHYVKLSGQVGTITNGSGLGLAVIDMLHQLSDGRVTAANFLDMGASTAANKIDIALKLVLADPTVKSILICVFGSTIGCDEIARDIINTYEGTPPDQEIIVRLEGHRVTDGITLLKQAGIPNVSAYQNLTDAVQHSIRAAQEADHGNIPD